MKFGDVDNGLAFAVASLYAWGMTRMKLGPAATVADVARLLDKPVDYVRLALSNLHPFANENHGARLTIGVTGKGVSPHYKIDVPDELDLGGGKPLEITSVTKIYDGRTHVELRDITAQDTLRENWSSRSMSIDELKQLLGTLRNIERQ